MLSDRRVSPDWVFIFKPLIFRSANCHHSNGWVRFITEKKNYFYRQEASGSSSRSYYIQSELFISLWLRYILNWNNSFRFLLFALVYRVYLFPYPAAGEKSKCISVYVYNRPSWFRRCIAWRMYCIRFLSWQRDLLAWLEILRVSLYLHFRELHAERKCNNIIRPRLNGREKVLAWHREEAPL